MIKNLFLSFWLWFIFSPDFQDAIREHISARSSLQVFHSCYNLVLLFEDFKVPGEGAARITQTGLKWCTILVSSNNYILLFFVSRMLSPSCAKFENPIHRIRECRVCIVFLLFCVTYIVCWCCYMYIKTNLVEAHFKMALFS